MYEKYRESNALAELSRALTGKRQAQDQPAEASSQESTPTSSGSEESSSPSDGSTTGASSIETKEGAAGRSSTGGATSTGNKVLSEECSGQPSSEHGEQPSSEDGEAGGGQPMDEGRETQSTMAWYATAFIDAFDEEFRAMVAAPGAGASLDAALYAIDALDLPLSEDTRHCLTGVASKEGAPAR